MFLCYEVTKTRRKLFFIPIHSEEIMFFKVIRLIAITIFVSIFLSACSSSQTGTGEVSGNVYPRDSYIASQDTPPILGEVNGIPVPDRVFFGFDSSVLSPGAQNTLELQASWLRKNPNGHIAIEGHCDERGTREYNLALGERRAASVRNFLVNLGIRPSRISTISYGKERPAILGSDEEAWSQNRRGVTVITQ